MNDRVLGSWKDGPAKQAILDFVDAATTQQDVEVVSTLLEAFAHSWAGTTPEEFAVAGARLDEDGEAAEARPPVRRSGLPADARVVRPAARERVPGEHARRLGHRLRHGVCMSDLTAIDILVNPDEATLEHARVWNARMRRSVTDGFALDDSHQPHITTLQRYVRAQPSWTTSSTPSNRRWRRPTRMRSTGSTATSPLRSDQTATPPTSETRP